MAFFLGKNSIDTLETQLEKAKTEYAAAESSFSAAVTAMEDPPIELTDDQVGDLVGVKNLAEVRLVRARAIARRAELALAAAKTEQETKVRETARVAIVAKRDAAAALVRKELPALVSIARRLLKAKAEADLAIHKYNITVSREERLPSLDDELLCSPSIPERELDRERLTLWVNGYGSEPFPDQVAKHIQEQPDGTGLLVSKYDSNSPFIGARTDRLTARRVYDKITTLPAVSGHGPGGTLAEVLSLPGLGGEVGWQPVTGGPGAVLAALARLEEGNRQPGRKPEPQTVLKPVSPILNSRAELLAWERQQAGVADAAE